MVASKWGFLGLVVLASVSFWLLLAGPDRVLGLDTGNLGIGLATLVAWSSLYRVMTAPRGELDETVSPAEWQAWIGFGFIALMIAYLLAKADVIAGATDLRDLGAVGRSVAMLLVSWAVLAWHLGQRWKDVVREDERDREIAIRAAGWGRGAMVFVVIGVIVTLGLTPAARLAWATPIVVAHLLVFALLWGSLVECAVAAGMHWRDRRP